MSKVSWLKCQETVPIQPPKKLDLVFKSFIQQNVGTILMLYSKEARWCSESESDLTLIKNTCKKDKQLSHVALPNGKLFLNINGYS